MINSPSAKAKVINNYLYVEMHYDDPRFYNHRILVWFPYKTLDPCVSGGQVFFKAMYTNGVLDKYAVEGPTAFFEDVLAHENDIDAWIMQMLKDLKLITNNGLGQGITKPGVPSCRRARAMDIDAWRAANPQKRASVVEE